MEDLLQQIITECGTNKFTAIKSSAQTAYDLLLSQQTLLRDPAHELRAKCYQVLQSALETKKSKFVTFALTGFHKILRDDRFQTNFEPEDDSLWLPSQFLHAVSSIMSQSDDTQVDILKVLLNIACSTYWTVNGRIIIQMLTVCADVYENGTEAVKTASQAAANQTLRSFCHLLDVESQEAKDDKMHEVGSGGIACFNELIPILQYICSKLDEAQMGQNVASSLLLLEGLHTVLSSLPQRIYTNSHFTKFLWQKLCPALIGLMGLNRNANSTFTKFQSNDVCYSQSKIIYSIAGQLVRLVGCVGSLRPVLESLYHRMLLFPKPAQRLDPIKALAELLRSPSRLVDFAGPLLVEDDRGISQQSDMALTRLIMDSLQECSESKDVNLILSSVTCVEILLDTLLKISDGQSLNPVYVSKINQLYPTLSLCDYKGPLTYQTLCRLPKTYCDTVGVSESQDEDTVAKQQDMLADSHSEDDCSDSSDDLSIDEQEGPMPATLGFHESLGSIQHEKVYSKEKGDCERDNARYYFETLLEFLPSLLPLKFSIEIDDALQKFASKYCQGIYYKESKNSDLESAIVNADGIYLATYSALSLNLKLINVGFYENNTDEIPLTEEQFVREVEESGVLVYLSSRWLCELYQQILCVNLLKNSGCDTNLAVLNLLSDLGGIYFETEVLANCAKLDKAASRQISTAEIQAGQKLARRLLTCCWDSLLTVVTEGVKGDQETLPHSLRALHTAALLCNATGLQKKSGSVFSLLSNACCIEYEDRPPLMASHILSLDVLLSRSLELASHAPHSWPHVLKCALYVTNLEHMLTYSHPNKSPKLNESDTTLENIIPKSNESDMASVVGDLPGTALLNPQSIANAVCILSQHIDRLFENAALKLKLNSLLSFCSAVCCSSDKQLSTGLSGKSGKKLNNLMWLIKGNKSAPPPPLLLSRLAQLVIKAARSGRPLIHIMKLWSNVGPHLMHAACHKDPIVSKLAVSCIHDIMTTLLNENVELEHFHFNEALFKPFENLLCLELCDSDIQDQVVNCISEFVEGSQAEIKSGWRPLFRALGGVATSNHIESLVEVFQVFLNTSNPSVFANAAMDFIQCLTKHVRGNGVSEQTDDDSECRAVLDYVEKCSQMLCLMHSMTSCPRFNTARRLEERITDDGFPIVPDPGGALAVWAELIEGLASVVLLSPKAYQPVILELLFSMLTDMYEKPGIEFNLYCVSYIIIASIQRWTVYNSHDLNLWDLQASSFRQYCGMTTHFVIRLLIHLRERQEEDKGSLMLQKLVTVMTDCATIPVESVARLGCACLRHIVVTGSDILTRDQWTEVISGVARATRTLLTPLNTLNAVYSHNCHQYYGDLAHIKVAARKDSSVERNSRLQHLAQQVLLLENQRKGFSPSENEQSDDERSYVLLIYDSCDSPTTRDCVPLGNLLVSLLAHQMLLQTIGTVLLQGTQHEIPSLAGVVQNNSRDVRILENLHNDSVEMLLSCLELSYNTAVEFDSRPGLKFLIQKVAGLDRAANLYRQAGAAWTINLISLFDLCLCNSHDYVKDLLPKLRQSLEELCDTYVEVLLDKDGIHSAVDFIEEKISFLIAQTDDIPGLSRSSSERSEEDLKSTDGGCRTDVTDDNHKTPVESTSLETTIDKRDLGAEIERQKEESICKDREAHMGVWAEILVSALQLLCQLDETSLRTLLPAVFPTVRILTAHASHGSLRLQLAVLFDKVALIYGFSQHST